MKHSFDPNLCVLAIDPASRGLGYAVFEGPDALIDWGFRNIRRVRKDVRSVEYVEMLLRRYKPDVLVLESFDSDNHVHRSPRVLALLCAFTSAATKRGTRCERISRHAVRAVFASSNKYEIARKLAVRFPETKHWCPPPRKIWQSEDTRINIFDALALASTYFTVGPEFMQRRRAA
jgi:hypothetical protein